MKNLSGGNLEVTRDDQNNINTFSKLYTRRQEIDEALIKLKEKINLHQDTLDEIEMNDDD
jgi:chaperonin cofactor prefoldin